MQPCIGELFIALHLCLFCFLLYPIIIIIVVIFWGFKVLCFSFFAELVKMKINVAFGCF